MGCANSKTSEIELTPVTHSAAGNCDIRVESVSQYHEQITGALQRDFLDNQQIFLLNSMLLNVQFFENYQNDIVKLFHSTTNKKEKALNRILLQHETVECTCPDIIIDNVNKNIRYRQLHGPKKNKPDTLAPKRLFVVYDRIEVVNSVEIPQYTSIDKPAYQVRLENSNKKGFVRLKYIDVNNPPKSNAVPSEPPKVPPEPTTVPPKPTTVPPEPTTVPPKPTAVPPEPTTVPPEPVPSTSKDPDPEIYEYNTIYQLKTPKPLVVSKLSVRRDTLPEACFNKLKVPISHVQFAEIRMQNEDKNVEIKIEDYFDTVTYIDAKGFMDYFKNGLFPNSLGKSMGFNDKNINEAKAIPGKIFCNLTDDKDNPIPCEVIPSVSIPWPEDQTYEFMHREERPTVTDTRNGFVYRWPTDDMLQEIEQMSCVVVPSGYWEKKGQTPDATLEWQIAFPKAERYLEARMSHAQIKCYLFLLALLKTYIEPKTHQHGLLPEHIRCHMFWECEANYRDWPEHRLGDKIMQVIQNLNNHLSRGVLPDYFIKSKNLFRNIPKKYLQFAQKQFHIIIQSPSMYFLRALRNIWYYPGKFYAPVDFKELYKILTEPQGPKNIIQRVHSVANQNSKSRKYDDRDLQIKYERELERRAKVLQKIKEKQEEENNKNRKDSVDSIDLEWICKNDLDRYKSRALLIYFIRIYIQIATDSLRLAANNQAKFYLKQASYLSIILERISPIFREDASEFKAAIHELEQASISVKVADKDGDDLPPMTPVRNSGQFDFSAEQRVRSNTIDRENRVNSVGGSEVRVKFAPSVAKKTAVQRVKSMEVAPRKSVTFIESK
ncbi:unnamed protein product [Phaedon cochleariae]|uniref:Mab-21-like HhH/H2TH-like domain-containing protein n=1 Tax=Phaedon cochleariae TaxID=80249 RepID=A0A9P0DMV4_PHACE|nr:unnamed protein product [Phaedon cochleariae]